MATNILLAILVTSLATYISRFFGVMFYFISPEWSILFGGFTAGTLAFYIGELNGN